MINRGLEVVGGVGFVAWVLCLAVYAYTESEGMPINGWMYASLMFYAIAMASIMILDARKFAAKKNEDPHPYHTMD